jgi:putative spermidine/putrescine transport system permease protein
MPAHTSPLGRIGLLAYRALALAVLAFLILPILVILPLSFNAGTLLTYPLTGLSLRWYENLFTNAQWLLALKNSVIVGVATMILATALGTLTALGLAHARFRYKPLLMALLISPMIVDQSLVRAGASLGASPVRVFFRITLPIVLPGVLSGALFAFAVSFDEVVVALFLAAPEQRTLPRQLFSGVRDTINPTVTAVATMLVAISGVLMATMELLRRRSERLSGLGAWKKQG